MFLIGNKSLYNYNIYNNCDTYVVLGVISIYRVVILVPPQFWKVCNNCGLGRKSIVSRKYLIPSYIITKDSLLIL